MPPTLLPYRKGRSKAPSNVGAALGSSIPSRLRYEAWENRRAKMGAHEARWKGDAGGWSSEGIDGGGPSKDKHHVDETLRETQFKTTSSCVGVDFGLVKGIMGYGGEGQ